MFSKECSQTSYGQYINTFVILQLSVLKLYNSVMITTGSCLLRNRTGLTAFPLGMFGIYQWFKSGGWLGNL